MNPIIRPLIVVFAILTLFTGVIYPALVTVIGQVGFSRQVNGSLIKRSGEWIGSELIGQSFGLPQYFWGRPSATVPSPYNAAASTGSNLGPTNPALWKAFEDRLRSIQQAHPNESGPVPVDLLTASGSGLDPHISPAAAKYQVVRVAKARNRTLLEISDLIESITEPRTFGLLGEPRINVLKLNLALDRSRRTGHAGAITSSKSHRRSP